MAAISIGVQRGFGTFLMGTGSGAGNAQYSISTNAPSGTNDIELRFNQTDQSSKDLTTKDLIVALDGLIRLLRRGGSTVNFIKSAGNTVIGPP